MPRLSLPFGLALAAALAACASPPTRFYALSEHPVAAGAAPVPAVSVTTAAAPARLGVYVADVEVPASVDRQPLVLSEGGDRLQLKEFDQWAAPLGSQATRVIVGNLRQLLGVPTVSSEAGLVGVPRPYRLRVVLERFEGQVGGSVAVRARWSINRPDAAGAERGPPLVGTVTVSHPVAGPRVDDVVAGWNDALWEVSQNIARSLETAGRS